MPTERSPLLAPILAAALLVLGSSLAAVDRAPADGAEVRALWVTRSSLTSPAGIAAMVRSAAASRFNTLIVQVRGRGDAFYASGREPRAAQLAGRPETFDPLAATIEAAHAQGLRVHAWFNVNLVSSAADLPASREHIIYQRPEWLMVPRDIAHEIERTPARSPEFLGRLARWTRAASEDVEGLYVSPIHADAAAYTATIIADVAGRYALDGIHLDYIRYPGPGFDYSRRALTAFRRALDADLTPGERARFGLADMNDLVGAAEAFPARWADFRRSRLNALVMRVRTAVKSRRPSVVLSAAVYPDPIQAAAERLQDWRTWVDHRLIDVVCPMAYTPDTQVFASQIAGVRQLAADRPVWAGIGAYRLSSTQTVENILAARRLGAAGIVLFSYDSLTRLPNGGDYLPSVARAAFTP